ncbi:MAG: hypothetical protein ABFS19_12205 [Thermodesulfobacteriota bacterium]
MTRKTIILSALLICVLTPFSQVSASKIPSAELSAIHQRFLNDPANNDLLYEYARTAVRDGNFEAAISVLESLLVITPNQPRVMLELGVLYQRLCVPKTATIYLETAQKLAGDNSEIAILAEEYLYRYEQRDSPNRFNGVVRLGARYQSNPTLSPEIPEILSGGFNVPLPEARKRESDFNGYLFSRLSHRYAMAEKAFFVTDLTLYGTLYNEHDHLNYGVAELATGPRYESAMNANGQFTVRPLVILRGSSLDGELFEQTTGAGIDFGITPAADTWFIPRLKLQYQYRDIEYEDFNDQGSAPLRNGEEHRLDLRFITEWIRGNLLEIGFFGRQKGAERLYMEVDQYDFSLRYSFRFNNFLNGRPRMTATPFVIYRAIDFGGPDPEIDSSISREDRQWRMGLNYRLPTSPTSAMMLCLERTESDSNIINYDFENNLIKLSYQKEF